MNFEPYKVVIGAIIRHFATILAGYLLAYGVTKEEASAAVEATVAIALAVIIYLVTVAWSYVSKRIAFETPTGRE